MLKKAKTLFNEIITEYGIEVKSVKIQAIQYGGFFLGEDKNYTSKFYQRVVIEVLEKDGDIHEYDYNIIHTPKYGKKNAIAYAKRIMQNMEKTYKPTDSIGWELLEWGTLKHPLTFTR